MSKQVTGSLFTTEDFRLYVRAWVEAKGRGEFRKIATALKMHTTLISQVFSGRKNLTEEQASQLCNYLSLNVLETDYFLALVQKERAGTENLKRIYDRRLQEYREQANSASSRVPKAKKLSEQDRAIFYSSWQYSLVRLLTSIDGTQTEIEIANHLKLPPARVREILEFLYSRGLCTKSNEGKYSRTEKNTHVEAGSPLAVRHHQNWRMKALALQERMTLDDLAFTAPLSVAKNDIVKVRAILLEAISAVAKVVEASPAEEVVYLGIDWIKYR